MNAIRKGVKHVDPKNDVTSGWAVKSKSFDNVWLVAAKVYGAGMENGFDPGVWAIYGSPAKPSMIGQSHLSRVRTDHAPENFAILRHMALNLLKQESTAKVDIKAKRLKAAWDRTYLLQVLPG